MVVIFPQVYHGGMQENGPKAVPAGIADFKEIRKSGYYFVDKSEIISDILKDRAKAYLFTRPRRFGKSMNLSMLDAFFNVKYAGNGWFDDLKVSGHPEVEKHKNVYPVVNLDMKDLPTDDYSEFVSGVGLLVSNLYNDHGYLEDFLDDPVDSDRFERARRQRLTKGELRESLRFLCKLLKSHHGVSPIVLIDEYDDAVNNSSDKDSYEGILEFLSGLYSSTLKGNDCLKFAVVTGVMHIGKGSICTGINNLKIDNMFTEQFDERFGFTASEVGSLCEHYRHGEKFDEMRRWYGGYRFGNAEIFNPRSVLNYVGAGFKPGVYRADTDRNDALDRLIGCSNLDTYRELQSLAEGRPVKKSLSQVITLCDMGINRDAVFSIMVSTGYLNAMPIEEDYYKLSIPNMEMRKVFSSMLLDRIHSGASLAFKFFFEGMIHADTNKMKEGLDSILYDNIPFFVLSKEKDYQLIIAAAAMSLLGRYSVDLEKESGDGRADIVMRPNRPGLPNVIFELKNTDGDDLVAETEKAICQIKDRRYFHGMEGKTFLYGICFQGKRSAISMETIDLS